MLAFIITLVLAIGLGILAYFMLDVGGNFTDAAGIISTAISLLGWIAILFMLIAILLVNADTKGQIAAYQQRYDSLVYQLENDLYDNDNDLGKKELYNEIRDWNEDLARGKAMQYDIWAGWFYPNIYDNFEFIELG